jgi:hypothetical protein
MGKLGTIIIPAFSAGGYTDSSLEILRKCFSTGETSILGSDMIHLPFVEISGPQAITIKTSNSDLIVKNADKLIISLKTIARNKKACRTFLQGTPCHFPTN